MLSGIAREVADRMTARNNGGDLKIIGAHFR